MQTLARQIEADTRLVLMNIDMDLNIGLILFDYRTTATELTKSIDDRILSLERDKLAMIEL